MHGHVVDRCFSYLMNLEANEIYRIYNFSQFGRNQKYVTVIIISCIYCYINQSCFLLV